ncbi:MAG: TRAP transporter small permease subunit [Comamonadaceae bacterium]|nr:MAG: TRAP transporter small permease subunit [Comamonadaceae bacterium]
MNDSSRLFRATETLARIAQALACLLLLASFVLINAEVVARYAFNSSTLVADEYSTYFFAGMVYLGLTNALHRDRLIKVDLPSAWSRFSGSTAVRIVVAALGLLLNLTLLYAMFLTTALSWRFQSRSIQPSQTLLFYPQSVVLLALGTAALTALLIFVGVCRRRGPQA